MCVQHMCTWYPGSSEVVRSRRACESLVSAGNRTRVLCKSNKCSQLLRHLSRPHVTFLAVTKCLEKVI